MTAVLVEQADRWALDLAGAPVGECTTGHAVALRLDTADGPVWLRLESDFDLVVPGRPDVHVPTGEAPPELRHAGVVRLEAFHDGRLVLHLAGGGQVRVAPDQDYEAWTLAGPAGLRLVSVPGGDLAVWTPAP